MYQYQTPTAFHLFADLHVKPDNITAAWTTRRTILNCEQLMVRVTKGDAAALEALYDQYAPAVLGLALKMLGDKSAAEEIVQETFWRVWRNADSFRVQQGSFTSWLFGITRNLSIDTWRRRKVRPQPVFDQDEEQQLEHNPDPEVDVSESAWVAMKHSQVRQALGSLPASQREVVEMAFFWGLTRQEIAEKLEVPLGTIHTRARLGLQKLREALQEQGFEE
jgi:RNA polymerase sigma-70 factor (ECF subfamily)